MKIEQLLAVLILLCLGFSFVMNHRLYKKLEEARMLTVVQHYEMLDERVPEAAPKQSGDIIIGGDPCTEEGRGK